MYYTLMVDLSIFLTWCINIRCGFPFLMFHIIPHWVYAILEDIRTFSLISQDDDIYIVKDTCAGNPLIGLERAKKKEEKVISTGR